jgi:hypothetical protein
MTTTTVCAGSGTAAGPALVAEDAGALPGEGCLPTAVVAGAELIWPDGLLAGPEPPQPASSTTPANTLAAPTRARPAAPARARPGGPGSLGRRPCARLSRAFKLSRAIMSLR